MAIGLKFLTDSTCLQHLPRMCLSLVFWLSYNSKPLMWALDICVIIQVELISLKFCLGIVLGFRPYAKFWERDVWDDGS
jgi:hypothetical protein